MKPLIIANWKMNIGLKEAKAFCKALQKKKEIQEIETVICPQFPLLSILKDALSGTSYKLGGQDCGEEEQGAYTGDVSAGILKEMGCHYVIVGHSERRQAPHHETDERVLKKAKRAQKEGLVPIICIGETIETYKAGKTKERLSQQIKASTPQQGQYIIAYEPIWAIGTGKTPTEEEIEDCQALIHKESGKPVIYGGSVNEKNIKGIIEQPSVRGVLIGGASLNVDTFWEIMVNASTK